MTGRINMPQEFVLNIKTLKGEMQI